MKQTTNTHGGRRAGSGRKTSQGGPTSTSSVSMTADLWAKVDRLVKERALTGRSALVQALVRATRERGARS